VIGARTERYGDFIDLCCALTGRAPEFGLHVEANRRASVLVEVASIPAEWDGAELTSVAVGHLVGPPGRRNTWDHRPARDHHRGRPQGIGRRRGVVGRVALFHAIGLTPEAPTLEAAFGGRAPERIVRFAADDLREAVPQPVDSQRGRTARRRHARHAAFSRWKNSRD